MLYLYYGKIGDGKTYHVVNRELIPALLSGRKVYTNIDGLHLKNLATYLSLDYYTLSTQLVTVESSSHVEVKNLYKIAEQGSLIIYDEAHDYFDAREFKTADKGFHDFLTKSRKGGYDIVFITQSPKRLDSNIVRICNMSYQVKNIGFLGRLVKQMYVVHVRQSPFDAIVSTFRGRYSSSIFSLYRSFAVEVSKASKVRVQQSLLGGKALIFVVCSLVLLLFIVSRGGLGVLNASKAIEKQKNIVQKVGGEKNEISAFNLVTSPAPLGVAQVDKEKTSSGEVDCEFRGYVSSGSERLEYYDCAGKMKAYRNGKIYFSAAPLPAYPALAEEGKGAALSSFGDLVSNGNNSNTLSYGK